MLLKLTELEREKKLIYRKYYTIITLVLLNLSGMLFSDKTKELFIAEFLNTCSTAHFQKHFFVFTFKW